jgi:RNA polymerase sigma factor (sigma-70 family)
MNPRPLAPARLARSVLRTQSDERLAELAAGGSDAAFEALVARHRRALVARCAHVVGADAEEAVQDALMRALAALRRGDEVRHVGAWLHVIAHRVALNLRRAQAARGECALEDVADGERADDGTRAADRARLSEVVAAVGALPPRQRDAIVMRELEGRSYVEIAERLGSSPGAVRQLLHRARAGVRERAAGALAWEPLVRWASSIGPGSRLGALSDACLATAKVCATLLPVAVVGVGAVATLDVRHAATVRRPATTATTVARTTTPVARHRVAVVRASSKPSPSSTVSAAVAVAPRAPARLTVTQPAAAIRFVSVARSSSPSVSRAPAIRRTSPTVSRPPASRRTSPTRPPRATSPPTPEPSADTAGPAAPEQAAATPEAANAAAGPAAPPRAAPALATPPATAAPAPPATAAPAAPATAAAPATTAQ